MIIPGGLQRWLDSQTWYGSYIERRVERSVRAWRDRPSGDSPPQGIKIQRISALAEMYGANVLVETGTYLGDTLYAVKDRFAHVHSIELSQRLHDRARQRFRGCVNVSLYQGDSGERLAEVVRTLDRPAIFWLDAHYSSGITARADLDSPVVAEVAAVAGAARHRHLMLIDDARCFTGSQGYPTVDALRTWAEEKFPDYSFEVREDIIEILPPLAPEAARREPDHST